MNSLFFFSNSSCISWSQLPCVLWQMSCRSIDLTKKNTFSCIFHSHPHDRLFVFEKLRKLRPIPSIIVKWHFFFFCKIQFSFLWLCVKGEETWWGKSLSQWMRYAMSGQQDTQESGFGLATVMGVAIPSLLRPWLALPLCSLPGHPSTAVALNQASARTPQFPQSFDF